MKRFKLEQSNADIISHSGQAIKNQTRLSQKLDIQVPLRHGIKHSDVLKSYLALLSTGKNDFDRYLLLQYLHFQHPCRSSHQ